MMRSIFIAVLLLKASSIFAQGEFIIELDPATGSFTKKGGAIQGIHYIFPDVRAYDQVNGRMIFPGGDPTPDHLYSMNVSDGSIASNPLYPSSGSLSLSEPQFDNSTETLYMLYHDQTASEYYLATVDPTTAAYSQLGTTPIPGISGLYQGMETYDENDHEYILYSSGTLYSIDGQTGGVVNSPLLMLQTGDNLMNMSFNNANDTLYGLKRNGTNQLYYLVWIDQATGILTEIGNGTTLGAGNGSSTVDEVGHRFIYQYSDQGNYYLSVMDLDDGSIIYNNQIVLDAIDNVFDVEYDNAQQKLYAIHWDNLIETTGLASWPDVNALVYPDPTTEEVRVRFGKYESNVRVELYNVNGQQLRVADEKQVIEVVLPLDKLSAGPYFLKISTDAGSISKKFVKQ